MVGILTGDIINSRRDDDQGTWLAPLKQVLQGLGAPPVDWEIFRGDSFQLEVKKPEETFQIALLLKATIKSVRSYDLRLAIGIGEKTYHAERITESNGPAFVHSGEKFELLQQEKVSLAIKSPWPGLDKELNTCMKLALVAIDNWTVGLAEIVALTMQNQELLQAEVGKKLGIKQNAVSGRLKRAHYHELMEFEALFRQKIGSHLHGVHS